MIQEKEEKEGLSEKFPESAEKARELVASIFKEVEWDDFGMGHTELTFEFAVAQGIPRSDLPLDLVNLVEALWRIFGYISPDGYHYTIAKVPYWSNGFRLSQETLVRTRSKEAFHLVNAFDTILHRYDTGFKEKLE
jgi:hypothetical protein